MQLSHTSTAPGQAAIAAATKEAQGRLDHLAQPQARQHAIKPVHVNSTMRTTRPTPASEPGDGPCAHGPARFRDSDAIQPALTPPTHDFLFIHVTNMYLQSLAVTATW